MTTRIFILSALCLFIILCPGLLSASEELSSRPAGKIVFVKGEVSGGRDSNLGLLTAGKTLAVGDLIVTGGGSRIKLLLDQSKTLVTILEGTKARITLEGAELLEGSSTSIQVKELDFLHPLAQMGERSRQISGTFVMRGGEQNIRILNLSNTFTRNSRPTFYWESDNPGNFLISLKMFQDNGELKPLWQSQTNLDSLPFPEKQPPLEKGKSYLWDLKDLSTNDEMATAEARFYFLSQEEQQALENEQVQLADFVTGDEEDKISGVFLKIELLKKYQLNDELKNYVIDLLVKYPENEAFRKIIKSF